MAEFPNKFFYESQLLTHKSTTMRKNPFSKIIPPTSFVQVAGVDKADKYHSYFNMEEAQCIGNIIRCLMKRVQHYDFTKKIGIITQYKAQQQIIKDVLLKIRNNIFDFVTVNTVDSFQGQEKDIILISAVKSKNMGFLSDVRRMNVSITRARHSLIIVGNFKTLSQSNAWKALLEHFKQHNVIFNHYKSIFTKK